MTEFHSLRGTKSWSGDAISYDGHPQVQNTLDLQREQGLEPFSEKNRKD